MAEVYIFIDLKKLHFFAKNDCGCLFEGFLKEICIL